MGPRPHGPAALRSFQRRLREHRGDPATLADEVPAIGDPAQVAQAWVALATHPASKPALRDRALRAALDATRAVQREGQRAETIVAALKALTDQDAKTTHGFVDLLVHFPDGEPLSRGIKDAAKHADRPGLEALFARALSNTGFERDDAKAVLRAALRDPDAAGAWTDAVLQVPDAELRARLVGYMLAQRPEAAASLLKPLITALEDLGPLDRDLGRDLWQSIIKSAPSVPVLEALEATAQGMAPDLRVDIRLALGAQADRLGDEAKARANFDAVAADAQTLSPRDAERIARKLEQARARLDGGPADAPKRAPTPATSARASDLPEPSGHALALHDTYTGGVKVHHFRIIAQAAALCAAFGLDLVLVDFPAPVAELAARTAKESRIGGRPFVRDLHAAGRVHEARADPATGDPAWTRWRWVATSEHATEATIDLATFVAEGPTCVVMGIGPKGLPKRLLDGCAARYEITGTGIGLETGSAMGVLADRLHQAAKKR